MKVKYFEDTDTVLLEFRDLPVASTSEVNEDVYIDVDADGVIVSMTIEHASRNACLPSVEVEQIGQGAA